MVDKNGAHLLSIIASYLRKCSFTRTIGTLLDESEGKISNEMGEVDLESLYTFYTSMQANGTSKKKKRKTEHADKLPESVINSIGELNEENKQSLAASVEVTGDGPQEPARNMQGEVLEHGIEEVVHQKKKQKKKDYATGNESTSALQECEKGGAEVERMTCNGKQKESKEKIKVDASTGHIKELERVTVAEEKQKGKKNRDKERQALDGEKMTTKSLEQKSKKDSTRSSGVSERAAHSKELERVMVTEEKKKGKKNRDKEIQILDGEKMTTKILEQKSKKDSTRSSGVSVRVLGVKDVDESYAPQNKPEEKSANKEKKVKENQKKSTLDVTTLIESILQHTEDDSKPMVRHEKIGRDGKNAMGKKHRKESFLKEDNDDSMLVDAKEITTESIKANGEVDASAKCKGVLGMSDFVRDNELSAKAEEEEKKKKKKKKKKKQKKNTESGKEKDAIDEDMNVEANMISAENNGSNFLRETELSIKRADKGNREMVDSMVANPKDAVKANKQDGASDDGNTPTGALAFKRVDIEKVAFSDPRLKNNSYWAKDGAEDGYGAKAQEVLGLVRGRDFRHEKTKKKRGTYKGGSIDFQSYSIKFENSDEE